MLETGHDVDGNTVGLEARRDTGGITSWSVPELRLHVLGGFAVKVGERDIEDADWYLQEAKSVIKFLALEPGHRVRRAELQEALWPERGDTALKNVKKALYIATCVLEPDLPPTGSSSYLRTQGDVVFLADDAPVWIDADTFESAVLTAKRIREPRFYEDALQLYTGDLLPEDWSEGWSLGPRKRLKDMYLDLLLDVATLQVRQGEVDAAITALQRLVVMDPAREEARVLLMRLFTA